MNRGAALFACCPHVCSAFRHAGLVNWKLKIAHTCECECDMFVSVTWSCDTLTACPPWTLTFHAAGGETGSRPLWLSTKLQQHLKMFKEMKLRAAKAFLSFSMVGKMLHYLVRFVTPSIEPLTFIIKPAFKQTKRLLMPRHWNNITPTQYNEGCWLKRAMREW